MRILDQFVRAAQVRHLSRHTIECYRVRIIDFLRFCRDEERWRHPRELGGADVGAFLTHLAADRRLIASSQFVGSAPRPAPAAAVGSRRRPATP